MSLPRLAARHILFISFISVLGASAGCAPRPTNPASGPLTPDDRAAIRRVDSAFVRGWLADDTAAVLRVFRADAVLLPPGGQPISGLAAIRSYWWPTDGSHTVITSFDRTIVEIEGTKGLAFLRGIGTLGWTYTKNGATAAQKSRSVDLILLAPDSAGEWRVVRQMWSQLP
jgi:uncharacterized protein (TIGR02246 family)